MENYKKGGAGRKPAGDRREYGNRPFRNDDRPRRTFGNDGNSSERQGKRYGDSDGRNRGFSRDDRPRRTFGDNAGRPRRNFGEDSGRPFGKFGENQDRPRRNFGSDRPRKPFGHDRSFDENSDRPHRTFGHDRPGSGFGKDRNFSGRSERRFDKPHGKPFGTRRPAQPNASTEGINRMISRKVELDNAALSDNDLVKVPVKETVRLNKFIANSGVCSRREADNFILAGVVTVNGQVVTELGTKINIYNDEIKFNGERLKGETKVYIVMNKPKGFVTTTSDPHADKTVMDLLKGCGARIFPVGRLDRNTTGVLMFTNDGEMAEKLTHPSYDKKKIYQVTLDSKLSAEDFEKIKSGVTLSDGEIAADGLEYIDDDDHRKVGIEIHSGKNRIVRRIFESLGYDVKSLDRVYFAGLTKKGLKRGGWRYLTEGEINILKMGAYN